MQVHPAELETPPPPFKPRGVLVRIDTQEEFDVLWNFFGFNVTFPDYVAGMNKDSDAVRILAQEFMQNFRKAMQPET